MLTRRPERAEQLLARRHDTRAAASVHCPSSDTMLLVMSMSCACVCVVCERVCVSVCVCVFVCVHSCVCVCRV